MEHAARRRRRGREVGAAVEHDLDRPAEPDGGGGRERLQRAVLGAEAASHIGGDHLHVVGCDAQQAGDAVPDHERPLRRGPHRYGPIDRVDGRGACLRFEVGLVHHRSAVGVLHHHVRLGEPGGDVAPRVLDPGDDVPGAFPRPAAGAAGVGVGVDAALLRGALRPHQRCVGLQSALRVDDGGQRLVLDVDAGHCVVGQCRGLGHYQRHRLALEHHPAGGEHGAGAVAGLLAGPWQVGGGQHGDHTRHRLGGGRVDAADLGGGVRAEERAPVEGAGQGDVGRVASAAGELGVRVGGQ